MAQSTKPPGDPDVLNALLAEVHGLRTAMEQMASAAPRVQLAIGQLQLQQQRLNTLIGRLDATRARLVAVQGDMLSKRERLEFLQKALEEPDVPGREEVKQLLTGLPRELAALAAEEQRLMADEASMTQDVATEQARWTEINQRIADLERALSTK